MKPSRLCRLLPISVGLSLFQSITAFAAVIPNTAITFYDGSDSLTVGVDGNPPTGCTSSVQIETCGYTLLPPAVGATASFSPHQFFDILDPNSSTVSDTVGAFSVPGAPYYNLTFNSDPETLLGSLGQGNTITEDGTVQYAFTLTWQTRNADNVLVPIATDTIYFQSDISESPPTGVPEPISLTLFGAGLIGLGALRRRYRVAA